MNIYICIYMSIYNPYTYVCLKYYSLWEKTQLTGRRERKFRRQMDGDWFGNSLIGLRTARGLGRKLKEETYATPRREPHWAPWGRWTRWSVWKRGLRCEWRIERWRRSCGINCDQSLTDGNIDIFKMCFQSCDESMPIPANDNKKNGEVFFPYLYTKL